MRSAVILLLCAGCWYGKSEGQRMRTDVDQLDERATRTEATLEARAKKLDESLDRATKLLARNSADLGTEVARFADELAKMNGVVAQLRQEMEVERTRSNQLAVRLDAVEKHLGIVRNEGGQVVLDPSAAFNSAYRKFQAGQFVDARREFTAFIQKFPADPRADNAQFAIGDSWVREKQYQKAIAAFQRVIDQYGKGDMADDAFLAAGNAALSMKWCVDASAYLGELIRRFPSSPLAAQAKQRLAYAKKNARNRKICQS
jgi:tol-pal system protein YbgF